MSNDVRINITTDASQAEQGMSRVRSSMQQTESASASLTSAFATLGGAAGIGMYIKSTIEAALSAEKLNAQFKATTTSAGMAAKEMQFIREESQRLGLNFTSTAEAYAKFMASTRNTSVEGEATRKIFSGVSEAVTALKLSGEQANGIFLALSQMMSKGKVSAEELRGQLGERLPGAFKLAADAMGLTTAELDKQITDGKIMSSDLLPKLAEELHKTYGIAAAESAKGGAAEIERWNNTLQESKRLMGEVFLPVLVEVLKTFNSGVDILKPFLYTINSIKIEATDMVEKFIALKDAGGLIGLITGGAEARAELREQFKAIDQMSEYSKDKFYNKLNPNSSSTKSAVELAAEKARVADAVAKEAAAKTKAAAEKLAKEKEEYDKLIQQKEIQRLQDQSKVKHDILRTEEKFAATTLKALQDKKKEIQDIQMAFLDSDRQFEEQRRQILGDYSGGFAFLDPDASAQQKAASLRDKLIEQEKQYQEISDPKEKTQRLVALSNEWGNLTQKIDFANMSQSEKMMQISAIEEERVRLQQQIRQGAEDEKRALEETYDTALVKVREYKAEVEALDALIKNMSREITIDMKINKSALAVAAAGGSVDNTDYSEQALYNAVGADTYNSWSSSSGGMGAGDSISSYAVGTSYIGQTGLRQVHAGEMISSRQEVSRLNRSGGTVNMTGGINVTVQGGDTSQQTAAQIARQILPEIQKLQGRYR